MRLMGQQMPTSARTRQSVKHTSSKEAFYDVPVYSKAKQNHPAT